MTSFYRRISATCRLNGQGLPRYGEADYGDIKIRIEVNIPKRITPEERKLFEQLRDIQRKRSNE